MSSNSALGQPLPTRDGGAKIMECCIAIHPLRSSCRNKEPSMDWQSIFYGVVSLISGIPMLLFPARQRQAALKAWDARRAELQAGASERYFEEGRSLEAYAPYRTNRKWRAMGTLLTFSGIALLYLGIDR